MTEMGAAMFADMPVSPRTATIPVGWLGADQAVALAEFFEKLAMAGESPSSHVPPWAAGFLRQFGQVLGEASEGLQADIDETVRQALAGLERDLSGESDE